MEEIARVYSEALFEVALDKGKLDEIHDQLPVMEHQCATCLVWLSFHVTNGPGSLLDALAHPMENLRTRPYRDRHPPVLPALGEVRGPAGSG